LTVLRQRRRGEPLFVLALIGLCWIGARIATWQTAEGQPSIVPALPSRATQVFARAEPLRPPSPSAAPAVPAAMASPLLLPPGRVAGDRLAPLEPVLAAAPRAPLLPVAPGLVGGHAMMWLAAVARMPGPEVLLEAARLAPPPAILTTPSVPPSRAPARRTECRWSGDAWALVRGGGGASAAGPGIATYGGNQVGAVLRYRLAPGSLHRPTAYLRASASLGGSGEREAAVGLSVRPVAGLPVIVAAEGRLGVLSGRAVARPAVMAVTEFAPMELPGRTRAEFYAQAGYVAGDNATPFADGQLRIDHRIVHAGTLELRAGAGAWGGAQRGAARFDVGPSATLGIAQGSAAARIGLDWRFRVAGSARPVSGPALTVSAGF
jgi:hypothetical protein